MKTLYHQKSGKSFIFLILKKRHYISSVILLYISTLQAGKHRLFLNILLFGKLHFPTWISPAAIHHTVLQALPATFLFLFLFDINCLWIPYIFLISWWLYSISFYAVLPYFIHSKSATTGSKTAFCSFFDYNHLKTQSFIQKADLPFHLHPACFSALSFLSYIWFYHICYKAPCLLFELFDMISNPLSTVINACEECRRLLFVSLKAFKWLMNSI